MESKTEKLKIAIAQMTSTDDVEANLMQIESLVQQVSQDNSIDILFLPENALYFRIKEGEKIAGLHLNDSVFAELIKLAQDKNFYIHVGASPVWFESHLYNSAVLISPTGDIQPSYQKMHLFDIQLNDQKAIRESDSFRHGQKPNIFEVKGWKFGESICYDIRFSELYSFYAKSDVDVILVPAAFLVPTGKAHWEILLRARAIESQCYVVAAAQAGVHQGHNPGAFRETYGHSTVVMPWGQVLVDAAEAKIGLHLATLEKKEITKVREQIPMTQHRRLPTFYSGV